MISWNDFCRLASELDLKPGYVEQTKPFFDALTPELYDRLSKGGAPDAAELKAAFPGEEYRRFLLIMAVASWPGMVQLYRSRNYSQRQLDDIRPDLGLWADKSVADTGGVAGLDMRMFGWTNSVRKGNVLQFGRLQCNDSHKFIGRIACFENAAGSFRLENAESHVEGALLSPGDPCICLHIPASGPLKRELCLDSFRRMAAFFDERNYPWRAFVCYSWILDPVFPKIMNSTHLADFQNLGPLFRMEGVDQTNEVVWRVFDIPGGTPADIGKRPWNTGMRRAVGKYLQEGGKFSEYGVIVLRRELPRLLGEI